MVGASDKSMALDTAPVILGVAEIDADHLKIADLLDALLGSQIDNADAAFSLIHLSNLVDAMCEHFVREEEIMRSVKYHRIQDHKHEHDNFMQNLSTILNNNETDNSQITIDTITMIRDWKFEHIYAHDKPLAEFILGH